MMPAFWKGYDLSVSQMAFPIRSVHPRMMREYCNRTCMVVEDDTETEKNLQLKKQSRWVMHLLHELSYNQNSKPD